MPQGTTAAIDIDGLPTQERGAGGHTFEIRGDRARPNDAAAFAELAGWGWAWTWSLAG